MIQLDAEDAHLLRRYRYAARRAGGRLYPGRKARRADGCWTTVQLAHDVLGVGYNTKVRYRDGNPFNARRSNLALPSGYHTTHDTGRLAFTAFARDRSVSLGAYDHPEDGARVRAAVNGTIAEARREAWPILRLYREVDQIANPLRVEMGLSPIVRRVANRADAVRGRLEWLFTTRAAEVRRWAAARLFSRERAEEVTAEVFARLVERAAGGASADDEAMWAVAREVVAEHRRRYWAERFRRGEVPGWAA